MIQFTTYLNNKQLSKKILKKLPTEVSVLNNIQELKHHLIDNRNIISTSIFKSNITLTTKWLSQQLLSFEFISDYSAENVLNILKHNNLSPNLILSSDKTFSIIFVLDKSINNIKHRNFIYKNISLLFNASSIVPINNIDKLYNDCLYINENLTDLEYLTYTSNLCRIGSKKKNTFRYLTSNFNNINENYMLNFYNNNNKHTLNNKTKLIQNYNFTESSSKIQVLDEFLKGDLKSQDILIGLITNTSYIKGGNKLIRDTMLYYNSIGKTNYTLNNFALFNIIKKYKYNPIQLKYFSPYKEDWKYNDLLNIDSNWKKGRVDILTEKPIKMSLETAEIKLKETLNQVIKKGKPGIHIITSPTGLGKTECEIDLKGNFLYSFPTHKLKDEVFDRCTVKNPNKLKDKTLKLPTFENNKYNIDIKELYNKHLYQEAILYLTRILSNDKLDMNERMKAKEYLDSNGRLKLFTHLSMFTTHQKAIHTNHMFNTVIFDEDPISYIFEINSFDIRWLKDFNAIEQKRLNSLLWEYTTEQRVKYNKPIKVNPMFTKQYSNFLDEVKNEHIGDLLKLIHSHSYYIDSTDKNIIHYITLNLDNFKIKEGRKTIILSSTALIPLYKYLFKDDVYVYDLNNVETVGNIIQYTQNSCSRYGLNNYKYITEIKSQINNNPVITFKDNKKDFDTSVNDIHLGNCLGYDELNGKDITVIGTNHKPNYVYSLYANALGIDLSNVDINSNISYRLIEWKGMKFKFNAFEHDELRELQLSLIESDLIQAVGRNRTLRNDCTTYVYSNLPLTISDEFIY